MTPVEAGSTCVVWSLRIFARAFVVLSATRSPPLVAQLALPALTSRAPQTPLEARMLARASLTGAACTLLVVNTAAAAAGTPDTIRERSSFSCLRMPAYAAAYLNPSGKSKGLIFPVVQYSLIDGRWRKLPPACVCGLRVAAPVIPGRRHRLPRRKLHHPVSGLPGPDSFYRPPGAIAKGAGTAHGTLCALRAMVASP